MKNTFRSRLITVLILVSISVSSSCKRDARGTLELKIVSDKVKIHRNPVSAVTQTGNYSEVRYRVLNKSDINVLLYNFTTRFTVADVESSVFCDSLNGAAEKLLFIKDETGRQIGIIYSTNINDSFFNVLEKSKTLFKQNKLVIHAGESLEFSGMADFSELNIPYPGNYKLRLLYTQNDVSYYVSPEEVETDIKNSGAFLFKGCLWSNEVNLVVE